MKARSIKAGAESTLLSLAPTPTSLLACRGATLVVVDPVGHLALDESLSCCQLHEGWVTRPAVSAKGDAYAVERKQE